MHPNPNLSLHIVSDNEVCDREDDFIVLSIFESMLMSKEKRDDYRAELASRLLDMQIHSLAS